VSHNQKYLLYQTFIITVLKKAGGLKNGAGGLKREAGGLKNEAVCRMSQDEQKPNNATYSTAFSFRVNARLQSRATRPLGEKKAVG
jgi:hypothetical protein